MKIEHHPKGNLWALILGASSGFGAACSHELAKIGFNIFGVHLDRQSTMPTVHKLIHDIQHHGSEAIFYNINAADPIKRNETLDEFSELFGQYPHAEINVLVHSLAFGTLKPFIGKTMEEMITKSQMEMTTDVMAHSLVYWTQGLISRKLMRYGGKIFAMTSEGGQHALPYYGAISAAKATLESHIRQLALELGPRGITANAILAGVTDTPALHKIPGAKNMLHIAKRKNPFGRPTTPMDVARVIALLSQEKTSFISGNVIGVDGAESKVSYVGQKNPFEFEELG